jgi:hypothetical protein
LAGLQQARASHAQAGELTYFSLGNNQYRVRVTFFRDCGGITPPASFLLTCRNGGCNGGTVVSATLTPPAGYPTAPGSFQQFQPYCASASSTWCPARRRRRAATLVPTPSPSNTKAP